MSCLTNDESEGWIDPLVCTNGIEKIQIVK